MSKFTGKICIYCGIEIMEGEILNENTNCFQHMRNRIEYWKKKYEESENELVKVIRKIIEISDQIKNRWSVEA